MDFDGVKVFCEVTGQPRPYVPESLRADLIKALHYDHLGIKSTLARVSAEYYWPSVQSDVKQFCKVCVPCKKVKQGKAM